MSLLRILLICVAVGLATGLAIGTFQHFTGSQWNGSAAVGAAIGVTGALLLAKRKK